MANLSHTLEILITGKLGTLKPIEEAGKKVEQLADNLESTTESSFRAANALEFLGKTVIAGILFKAVQSVLGLLSRLINKLISLGTGFFKAGMAASRYAASLEATSRAFRGIAGDDAPAMLDALRTNSMYMLDDLRLQEQYVHAYMLTGKELADRMPEAYYYLAKVAAATHDDLDFLIERTYRSVGRLSTRWMAYIGTVVETAEAEQHAAQMFGKTAGAITRTETQAAMLDLVLQKLAIRTASLPVPLMNVEQLYSRLSTTMTNLWGKFGELFLPAARSWLVFLNQSVEIVDKLVSKGGALYDFFRTISAAVSVLGDIASETIFELFQLDDILSDKLEQMANNILRVAWNAFSWGAKIVTELASGMIAAAAQALTAAINFISRMLTFWFRPASPPRIVPDIDRWGTETMNIYLQGFTLASFDILEGVQSKLENVLGAFVTAGWLTGQEAALIWLEVTADMVEGLEQLARTGYMAADMFDRLSDIGGVFGEHLVELAFLQYDYNMAVERSAEAVKALERAQKELDASQKHLTRSTDEYYMLLLSGATYSEMQAGRATREAARSRADLARTTLSAAEEEEQASKEQVEALRDRLQLQERIVDQLVKLLNKQAELFEDDEAGGAGGRSPTGRAGGAGGGAGLPIDMPEMPNLGAALGPSIDQDFEDLKDRIRLKFEELWGELAEIWEREGAKLNFDNLILAFGDIKTWWDENGPAIAGKAGKIAESLNLVELASRYVEVAWEAWVYFWETTGLHTLIYNALEPILGPTLEIGLAQLMTSFMLMPEFFLGLSKSITLLVKGIMDDIMYLIDIIGAFSRGDFEGAAAIHFEWFSGIGQRFQEIKVVWTETFENMGPIAEGVFGSWLQTTEIPQTLEDKLMEGPETAAEAWENRTFPGMETTVEGSIEGAIVPHIETLNEWMGVTLIESSQELESDWTGNVWPGMETTVREKTDGMVPHLETLKGWLDTELPDAGDTAATELESSMIQMSSAIVPVESDWTRFTDAVFSFHTFLRNNTFKFNVDTSDVPAWGTPDSPLPIHTAWKEFERYLKHSTFSPQMEGEMSGHRGGSEGTIYIERLILQDVQDAPDLVRQLREVAL